MSPLNFKQEYMSNLVPHNPIEIIDEITDETNKYLLNWNLLFGKSDAPINIPLCAWENKLK